MAEQAFEIIDYKKVFNLDAFSGYSAMAKIKPGSTLLFLSGLRSRDPKTGKLVEADLETQTKMIMERIKIALSSEGARMDDIFYLHVYLDASITSEDLQKYINPTMAKYFEGRLPPCNVVINIAHCVFHPNMPKGLLEIEAWAAVPGG